LLTASQDPRPPGSYHAAMLIRRAHTLILAASAFVAAGLWIHRNAEPPASAPDVATTSAAAPHVPLATAAATATKMSASAAPIAPSSAPTMTSLAARVDAWSRSGDPQQAMQAYKAIFQCLLARRRAHAPDMAPDAPGQNANTLCGDLRSDQIQARMASLETAARAGIKDAAANFIQEGPGGNGILADLSTTDPTPPTSEWLGRRTDYVTLALANCDTLLAAYLGFAVRDPALRSVASKYWLARMSCPDKPAAITTPLADDAQGQGYLDGLSINGWMR
jgi:hypothetical protein